MTGPLPLVIGISGHLDLRSEDVPALEARVQEILNRFSERYPHTPLVLLSPLAEGADRLAARVALRCGVRLVAPLPMAREEYARDFKTESSRAEFEALLGKAEEWFELPSLAPSGGFSAETGENSPRDRQYALVGAYIVHHCQILIALWNGLPSSGTAGTAQIVEFQREGLPEPYLGALTSTDSASRGMLDPVESGPVYHVVTPRASDPAVEGEPLSVRTVIPGEGAEHGGSESRYDRIYASIDAFNESALALERDPEQRSGSQKNAEYLLPGNDAQALSPGLQSLRTRYAIADTLAQRFQSLTLQALVRLCVLVFIAVLSFEVGAKLFSHNGWIALLFPLLLGITYAYWGSTVQRGRWQDRYQDYRALAEGLRVEFFWRLAGLPQSVADHYLRRQQSELDWIRIAIRNLSHAGLPRDGATPSEPDAGNRLALVLKHWVVDQARYFHRSAHRDDHELERYEKKIKGLMTAGPVLAAVTGLAMVVPTPVAHWIHEQETAHKLLIILVFLLLGVAGVLHTYVDKRALSQHAKQYERMGLLFGLAEQRLQPCVAAGEDAEARRLLLELGKEALAENGDWVLLHRDRPVDVPHAG